MIKVTSFEFNPFSENTYILSDETNECIIIDAGCYTPDEENELVNYISKNNLKPIKLINTHSHIDHVLGNKFIMNKYNIPLQMHQSELQGLKQAHIYGALWGINMQPSPDPTSFLEEGDVVIFGNSSLNVLLTPGHSIASISFYSKDNNFVISGDVLFNQSIGRTDLPGGDFQTLISSIKSKLFTLPDDTIVYSGHGETTKIGLEKWHNPFLKN
jgi:glyoxylase-like metal-dependent hydrolase (beta-lactamase superfamily II)